jgi:hypothetical protein
MMAPICEGVPTILPTPFAPLPALRILEQNGVLAAVEVPEHFPRLRTAECPRRRLASPHVKYMRRSVSCMQDQATIAWPGFFGGSHEHSLRRKIRAEGENIEPLNLQTNMNTGNHKGACEIRTVATQTRPCSKPR